MVMAALKYQLNGSKLGNVNIALDTKLLLDFFIFHYHPRHRNMIYVYQAFKTFL